MSRLATRPTRPGRARMAAVTAAILAVGAVPATAAPGGHPGAAPGAPTAGRPSEGRSTFLVRLDVRSTAEAFAASRGGGAGASAAGDAARSQLSAVRQAQDAVIARLPADSPVLYRTHSAIAGLGVSTDVANYASLSALPGVAAVYVVAPKTPDNSYAVPLQGAPPVWQGGGGSGGTTGAGTTVAVIDTGLDYTHADLGGPGTAAAYEAAHADEDQPADPALFPNAKVAGGVDLVGDAYDADPASPTYDPVPKPDGNPLDCDGHGSHVGGTVAGYGENADGTTYTGAYDTTTPFSTMRIGPGMAPGAQLYGYRVLGCEGSTDMVAAAVDLATDPDGDGDPSDHVDVISLSLGSDHADPLDGDTVAVDAASALGVVVAASAGNAGDLYDVGGSPGSAVRAITSAAGVDAATVGAVPPIVPADDDKVAAFSSRGAHGSGSLKPDVAAVGATVFSTAVGTGDGGTSRSGTSMASAMTAGLAALVRAARPAWTPEQVKADIMNTAGRDLYVDGSAEGTGGRYAPNRVGAGRIEAAPALANEVLAYVTDDPGAVSVSFGPVEVTGPTALTRTVRVQNTGATTATYTSGYDAVTTVPGVSYVVAPAAVSVPAGGSQDVTVTLTVTDPTLLTKTVDATKGRDSTYSFGDGSPIPAEVLADASGHLTLTPSTGSAPTLRVPVHAAPRPASTMTQPASLALSAGAVQSATLLLTGTGVDQGTGPEAVRSLAAGLELQAVSGLAPGCTATLTRVCVTGEDQRAADLAYVGVTTDEGAGIPTDQRFAYVGITTQAPAGTPAGRTELDVYLDTDADGEPDLMGSNTRLAGADVFMTSWVDLATGALVDQQPLNGRYGDLDTAAFDSDTVLMPITISALATYGVTAASPRVRYGVLTRSSSAPQVVDAVGFDPTLTTLTGDLGVDLVHPGLSVTAADGSGPLVTDMPGAPGTGLTVTRTASTYAADRGLGLLMVHLHNRAGAKAQVVELRSTPTVGLALTPATVAFGSPAAATVMVGGVPGTTATGSVSVVDAAGAVLATAPLVGGSVSLGFPSGTVGSRTLHAIYAGNPALGPAESAPQTLTVAKSAPTVGLAVTPATIGRGDAGSAAVTVTAPQGTVPTGQVALVDVASGSTLATGTLAAGRVTLSFSSDAAGALTLQAVYAGDGNVAPQSSVTTAVTVTRSKVRPTLTAPAAGKLGNRFRVRVRMSGVAGVRPTGRVELVLRTPLGKRVRGARLTNGVASFFYRPDVRGRVRISATYLGDDDYAPTSSTKVTVRVR